MSYRVLVCRFAFVFLFFVFHCTGFLIVTLRTIACASVCVCVCVCVCVARYAGRLTLGFLSMRLCWTSSSITSSSPSSSSVPLSSLHSASLFLSTSPTPPLHPLGGPSTICCRHRLICITYRVFLTEFFFFFGFLKSNAIGGSSLV